MKNNSLFKNTIYKSILSFVNIVVPLIIGPYITRLLDVDMYGVYNKTYAVFQMFLAFASFGIYTFGVREISKVRNDSKKISQVFTNLFLISIISNLLVTTIYLIYAFLTSTGLATTIYLVFLIQFVSNTIYVEFVNEAIENYKFITIKSIVVKIIYFISLLLFITKPTHVVYYAIVVSLTNFLNNIISFIYAKTKIKFDFSNIKIKKYFKPLIAVLVISNVELLYSQLDRVMLGAYLPAVSVTLYYIPYYLVGTLVSIPYSIINVSIPRLSYIVQNEGKKQYQEKLKNSISSVLFIIVPMCFGVFVVAREVILIYGGDKYIDAVIPLMFACITRVFITLESMVNNLVMYPNNQENRILRISLTFGIVNLVSNYILVYLKIFNPTTALLTTGLSALGVFISHYIYATKKMKIKINVFDKTNISYFLICLLFIPISLLIRTFNLGFIITLLSIMLSCSLFYFICLYIKKDNNLMYLLDKILKKVKIGAKE